MAKRFFSRGPIRARTSSPSTIPQQASPALSIVPPAPPKRVVKGQVMETAQLRSEVKALRNTKRDLERERNALETRVNGARNRGQIPQHTGPRGWWDSFVSVFRSSSPSAATSGAVQESVGLSFGALGVGIDADDHLYRRLTQAQRELPAIIQERALRLSWALYESNPLAHGIIEMEKDYVVGKGFTVHSADDDVQKVLDRHWDDPLNNWDIKQHDKVRDLCMYGEGFYLAFTNEATGHVRLASLDPILIRSIFTSPDNPEDIQTIVVNPKRGAGAALSDQDKFYRVIHQDEDPGSDTFGYLVGAKPGDVFSPAGSKKEYAYSGSCFFFAINRVTGAIRGRSDLLSVIDWLDAYDQILFNFVDRTLLMNSFVWDVVLTDATDNQILDWKRKHAMAPKPGTVNAHNQNEAWEAVSPMLRSSEFETQQKTLKAQILSAVGMPPHWFGEQDSNKATAAEQNSPAMKRLESRQLYVQFMVKSILQFQLDQAELAGKLKRKNRQADDYEPYKFEVSAPRMGSKDLTQASTSMLAVTQSPTIALSSGIIDITAARQVLVDLIKELGADVSLTEMEDRMPDELDTLYMQTAQGSDQPLEPSTVPGGSTKADPASKPRVAKKVPGGGKRTPESWIRGARNPYMPRSLAEAVAVLRDCGFDVRIPGPNPNGDTIPEEAEVVVEA